MQGNVKWQGMTPERISQRKASLATWLREGLVRLGPTFIKIGQQFSTRVDVLSPEFVKELEKLQVCSRASCRRDQLSCTCIFTIPAALRVLSHIVGLGHD